MNKHMKLTTLGLVSALMVAIAAPMTAQAGTMTIFNANCTTQKGLDLYKQIKVNIDSKGGEGCTDKTVKVHTGQSKTVQLAAQDKNGNTCGKYRHDAVGVMQNRQDKYDVDGDKDSTVICKKDRSVSCKCRKK